MKIFEQIEWSDGGPMDKGRVVSYLHGESEEQLKKLYGIDHSFISFREISQEVYNKRKTDAENHLKLFQL